MWLYETRKKGNGKTEDSRLGIHVAPCLYTRNLVFRVACELSTPWIPDLAVVETKLLETWVTLCDRQKPLCWVVRLASKIHNVIYRYRPWIPITQYPQIRRQKFGIVLPIAILTNLFINDFDGRKGVPPSPLFVRSEVVFF